MTDRFLMYSGCTKPTGEKLASFLGVESGKEMKESWGRYDYLIRWGTTTSVPFIPSQKTINLKRASKKAINKYRSLKIMDKADVPVPEYSREIDALDLPVLARNNNHSQGSDIELVLQKNDLMFIDADYYTEYIPVKKEYRIHVIDNKVVKVSRKYLENEDEYNPIIRNYENGYVFRRPNKKPESLYQAIVAVKAHSLDFGAVDMIISDQGNPYVLEVNTAPSLCRNSLKTYGNKLKQLIDKEEVPGIEAVEFDEDSNEDIEEEVNNE